MTSWLVVLVIAVPFLITGILYAIAIRNAGRKLLLLTLAFAYFLLNFIGPIWVSITYMTIADDARELWSAIAIVLLCRIIELLVLNIGKGFWLCWRDNLAAADKEEDKLMPPF